MTKAGLIQRLKCTLSIVTITFLIFSGLNINVFADATTTLPLITISKEFDGSQPFDSDDNSGNDTGANNDRVRAGQSTGFKFDMSLNDPDAADPTPYDNYTLTTEPLPLGFRWESLPLQCLTGVTPNSEIIGDGVTTSSQLICNMGTKNTGDTWSLSASVFTLPTVINNTVFNVIGSVNVDGVNNFDVDMSTDTVATVLPKLDLQKGGGSWRGTVTRGGVTGGIWTFGMGIKLLPGSEAPAMPITYTDNITNIHPNVEYVSCGISGELDSEFGTNGVALDMPLGINNNRYPATAWSNETLENPGTIDCSPQAGNDKIIDITIDNIPSIIEQYPTNLFNSRAAVSPGDNWIAANYIAVFIPYDVFTEENEYTIQGTNQLNDFAPTGLISGADNFNDPTQEPGRNLDNNETSGLTGLTNKENWYTQSFIRPTPGYFDKRDYVFRDRISDRDFTGDSVNGNTWFGYIGTSIRSGDGVMAAGGLYTSLTLNYLNGVINIPSGFIQCQTIDNLRTSVSPLPGHPDRGGFIYSTTPELLDQYASPRVQYGIGGTDGIGTNWTSYEDQRVATCADDQSTGGIWYDNLSDVPGGREAITKVRMILEDEFTVAEQLDIIDVSGRVNALMYMGVVLEVRADAEPGSIAPNYGKYFDPSGVWRAGWYNSTYNTLTATGRFGDRITVVGTRVRIEKTVGSTTVESESSLSGTESTWYLQPTSDALGITPAGTAINVKIVDTIPSGLNYIVNSAVCSDNNLLTPFSCDPIVEINADGSTTLTWEYGDITAGQEMSDIVFQTSIDSTAADGENFVNSATISADNDNSLEEWRTDTATVVVVNPAAFSVQKKSLTPLEEIGNDIVFRMIAKNTGANPVSSTEFIDWLPFNGDGRVPATDYTGVTKLKSFEVINGVDSDIFYSNFPYDQLNMPDDEDPLLVNPAIVWCLEEDFGDLGCPQNISDATGVKLVGGTLLGGEGFVYDMTLEPITGEINAKDDIYTNRFTGRISGLDLPVISNNVSARIIAGSIGDTVWYDRNNDGIQNNDEEGLEGVTVELLNLDGSPVDCDLNTVEIEPCVATTDENGNYLFESLLFDDYIVKVTPPDDFYSSYDLDGGLDSEAIVTITSAPSERDELDADFGFTKPADLGNYVWEDLNGDGIQGGDETGIEGVTVTLTDLEGNPVLDIDGNPVNPILTDASGEYSFTNLWPGEYNVSFNYPDNYYPTQENATDDELDSDINSDGQILSVPLLAEEFNDTNDVGLVQAASIGDTVWLDTNGDGVQDNDENGIEGITVTLLDADGNTVLDIDGNPVEPVTTDAGGNYLFDNLFPGEYQIQLSDTGTLKPTLQNNSDDENDSDINYDFISDTILVQSNEDLTDLDAGLVETVAISNLVWLDTNADGIQDEGEEGIVGVTVSLTDENGDPVLDADGNPVEAVTTDENGEYMFNNLIPGDYIVVFQRPDGYEPSQSLVGDQDDLDSDGVFTSYTQDSYQSNVITLSSDETTDTIDMGFFETASIGNYIWNDLNANGIQDGNESGVEGGTIKLFDIEGNQITEDIYGNDLTNITVNSDGSYLIENLIPGDYVVEFTPNEDYYLSDQNSGSDTSIDSDAGVDGLTDTISLSSGENEETIDFGVYQTSSIGDTVWLDTNADGIQDDNEVGIEGVTVSLTDENGNEVLDADGNPVEAVTTDENGNYVFDNLIPGDYVVNVEIPSAMNATDVNTGDSDTDSDINQNGTTSVITTQSGESIDNVDAGLFEPASIGNTIWLDANGDGIQDIDETGIEGIVVTITDENGNEVLDADGNPVEAVTTDENGNYVFDNLIPGDYIVNIQTPDEYEPTLSSQGDDDQVDSDIIVSQYGDDVYSSNPITLESGENNESIDAGLFEPASIGNYVWNDLNADGIQDDNETGSINGTIELYDADGNQITEDIYGNDLTNITVNSDGSYLIENLIPGDYVVKFIPESGYILSPDGSTSDDSDSDAGVDGLTDTISLSSGENEETIDFGVYQTATIGDTVWLDTNADGIQDDNEVGIEGVTVSLTDENGNEVLDADGNPVEAVTTDENGNYVFDNLIPGDYVVVFSTPENHNPTINNTEADPSLNSDGVNDGNGQDTYSSQPITVISNETISGIDMGFYETTSIGDSIWLDTNADGIQDDNEVGIEGIEVSIVDENGNEVLDADGNPVEAVTTDENGNYVFDNLVPGDYQIVVSIPEDMESSFQDATGEELDSDIDENGNSNIITTNSGDQIDNLDGGLYIPATVGNFIWEDLNGDGIQNENENGIEGITVNLVDEDGNIVQTVQTDENGEYLFENILPNEYTISVELGEYSPTVSDQGSDEEDSDLINYLNETEPFTLVSGENNTNIDMGLIIPSTITTTVWDDENQDGIQDDGESGISDITVTLVDENGDPVLDADGNPVEAVTTDENGDAVFENLIPGDYTIIIVDTDQTVPTTQDEGDDDSSDSDGVNTTDNVNTITLPTVTVTSGDEIEDLDQGLFTPGSIGNQVWIDVNGDGIQDIDEVGLEGVTVTLLDENGDPVTEDANGLPITSITTDQNGNYTFEDLPQGDYIVELSLPDDYKLTTQYQGDDQDLDSNFDITTLQSDIITVNSGDVIENIDAAVAVPTGIGNSVWLDTNGDGIQDEDENGIEGITVTLVDENGDPVLDIDGNPVEPVTTDENGNYSFLNLLPGDYQIITTIPDDYSITQQNQGDSDDFDSDSDLFGVVSNITLESGEFIQNIDIGLFIPVEISGTVWEDSNSDNEENDNDEGFAGIVVTITDENGDPVLDADGNPVEAVTTDENGNYVFDNLIPGDYIIVTEIPDNLYPSENTSDDPTTNSDGTFDEETSTTSTEVISLNSGEQETDIDQGIWQPTSIQGTLWEDENGDGIIDEGENTYSDIIITLTDENGDPVLDADGNPVEAVTTDENGNYVFDNLIPGDYQINITPIEGTVATNGGEDSQSLLPISCRNYGENSTNEPCSIPVTATSGEPEENINAGFVIPLDIGNIIWEDLDGDGVIDEGEPGIEGVILVITDEEGNPVIDANGNPVGPITTDENGNWEFLDLLPGTYTISVVDGANTLIPTEQGVGNDDINSDADEDFIITLSAVSGKDDNSVSIGLYEDYSISIEDPYVCGSGFFGIVVAKNAYNPVVSINLFKSDTGELIHVFFPELNDDGTYFFDLEYNNENTPNFVIQDNYRVEFVILDANGKSDSDELLNVNITTDCINIHDLIRSGGVFLGRRFIFLPILILLAFSILRLYSKNSY